MKYFDFLNHSSECLKELPRRSRPLFGVCRSVAVILFITSTNGIVCYPHVVPPCALPYNLRNTWAKLIMARDFPQGAGTIVTNFREAVAVSIDILGQFPICYHVPRLVNSLVKTA